MSAAALGDVSQERLHQFVSYLTVMSSFGKLLVGSGYWTHYGGSGSYVSSWAILDIDWADRDSIPQQLERLFQNITLSLLSDSGLMWAFSYYRQLQKLSRVLLTQVKQKFYFRRAREHHGEQLESHICVHEVRSSPGLRHQHLVHIHLCSGRLLRFLRQRRQLPEHLLNLPPCYKRHRDSIAYHIWRHRKRPPTQRSREYRSDAKWPRS
jgi:hypothetical protein